MVWHEYERKVLFFRTSLKSVGIFICLVSVVACSTTVEQPAPDSPAAFVIDGAQIWDGTGSPAISDGVLVVRGDRIDAVGPRSAVTVPEGATRIDAKGKTLIPGIITAHAHLALTSNGLEQSKDNYTKENILAQLKHYARYGVVAVMSLGTDLEPISDIRGTASPDESPRAAWFTAGRGFAGKGLYPEVLPGNDYFAVEVDTVDEIKAHIAELAEQKVDMVKIWVDDHFGHYKKMRPELYKAIIDEAHKRNLRVMAHLFYLNDAKDLVAYGLDGMAHSVRDRGIDDELIKLLKEKQSFAVASLTRELATFVYAEPPAFLDDPFFKKWAHPRAIQLLKDPAWGRRVKADPDFAKMPGTLAMGQKNLKKLVDAGVNVAFGTDTGPPGRFQGYFEHRELELMVESGLTPVQSLQIATLGSARALRIEKDFGSLEKNKRADFVLLDADPVQDILNTRKINRVWIGGRQVE